MPLTSGSWVGGYYYLVRLRRMDEDSGFILAHNLQRDMTSNSFIEVVQDAVDRSGMDQEGSGQRDTISRAQRKEARTLTTQEGGAGPND